MKPANLDEIKKDLQKMKIEIKNSEKERGERMSRLFERFEESYKNDPDSLKQIKEIATQYEPSKISIDDFKERTMKADDDFKKKHNRD